MGKVPKFMSQYAGQFVDLEAGDLPVDDSRYELRVLGDGETVLASQPFTVDTDGWAQVLLATSRPIAQGDAVEVVRVDGDRRVPVLRCDDCTA